MPKRLARKPSTASLMPASRNNANATLISPAVIAQITTGTSKMRPSVMRLGILKAPPGMVRAASRGPPPSFLSNIPAILPLHRYGVAPNVTLWFPERRPSAVNLKFLSFLAASSFRKFKFKTALKS